MTTKNEYPRAIIFRFDDWEGLYVDGKLASEGLRVSVCDLIDALYDTLVYVSDVEYHLSNKAMEEVLDRRRLDDTLCPLNLTEVGVENLQHVRI
jgi:hypothetical protein